MQCPVLELHTGMPLRKMIPRWKRRGWCQGFKFDPYQLTVAVEHQQWIDGFSVDYSTIVVSHKRDAFPDGNVTFGSRLLHCCWVGNELLLRIIQNQDSGRGIWLWRKCADYNIANGQSDS